jgi:hypothetical protein
MHERLEKKWFKKVKENLSRAMSLEIICRECDEQVLPLLESES